VKVGGLKTDFVFVVELTGVLKVHGLVLETVVLVEAGVLKVTGVLNTDPVFVEGGAVKVGWVLEVVEDGVLKIELVTGVLKVNGVVLDVAAATKVEGVASDFASVLKLDGVLKTDCVVTGALFEITGGWVLVKLKTGWLADCVLKLYTGCDAMGCITSDFTVLMLENTGVFIMFTILFTKYLISSTVNLYIPSGLSEYNFMFLRILLFSSVSNPSFQCKQKFDESILDSEEQEYMVLIKNCLKTMKQSLKSASVSYLMS
jgi:hypothetical protein